MKRTAAAAAVLVVVQYEMLKVQEVLSGARRCSDEWSSWLRINAKCPRRVRRR